jgi:hypothetical protein
MKKYNVDKIVSENKELSGGKTTFEIQQGIVDMIKEYAEGNNCNKIITNGNIGSVLQDVVNYSINNEHTPIESLKIEEKDGKKIYNMGKIEDMDLIIDALMLWNDNKIFLYNNDELKETIEVIDNNSVLI